MAEINIKAPSTGISQSPFVGYSDIRNLDIHSVQGIAKLNNATAKVSGSVVVTFPQWIVTNPATPAEKYALDNAGKVYRSGDSGATWVLMTGFTAGGHGNGLAIWKNYLFVARDAFLDVCGDGAASGNGTTTGIANNQWSNSWKAIDSDVLWHPMIVSKNDSKLYGGAGQYVFSLEEVAGQTFAPGTGGTYTYTQQALDLPKNYRIKCLEELGNNLMCGTWQGTVITDLRIADIFPWDRASVSFDKPISLAEFGVSAMINTGNSLRVLAGVDGAIYRCDGVNAVQIAQIPQSVCNISGSNYLEPLPGAICNWKGKLFFGVSGGGTSATGGCGVYSLFETSRGNILTNEHLISSGNDGTSVVLKIGAILPTARNNILIGWQDTSYGIDNLNTSAFYTGYTGYFDSPLYTVGSLLQQKTPTEIEFNLARPLRTSEAIRLAYRVDLTASFTTIATPTFATEGAVVSVNTIYDFPACEQIQFRIYLSGSGTSPELKGVTLRW